MRDFDDACNEFDNGLLRPTKLIINHHGFLGMYLAAALIDPLASAYHLSNVQGTKSDYKNFVALRMPSYATYKEEVYHVVRCGLVHGSRLDIETATPPSHVKLREVLLSNDAVAPSVTATNKLQIGIKHFFGELQAAFDRFRQAPTSDERLNFPLRFKIVVSVSYYSFRDLMGNVILQPRPASGGP